MSARRFLAAALLVILAAAAANADGPPIRVFHIGIVSGTLRSHPAHIAFEDRLRELGYLEGRNLTIDFVQDNDLDRLAAAELADLPVEVIVAGTRAIDNASGRVPVVVPTLFDPVGQGLASSLSRPGGNVTGFTLMSAELDAKRLELLKSAFPQISAVSVLRGGPPNAGPKTDVERIERAAATLGLGTARPVEALDVASLRALRPAVFAATDAIIVLGSGMFWDYRRDIVALVNQTRLPAIYPEREYADDGGLMAYGTNVPDNFRRAADYVDRILKGAKPGDLPIQEPV